MLPTALLLTAYCLLVAAVLLPPAFCPLLIFSLLPVLLAACLCNGPHEGIRAS
jgi:hypothetical protein